MTTGQRRTVVGLIAIVVACVVGYVVITGRRPATQPAPAPAGPAATAPAPPRPPTPPPPPPIPPRPIPSPPVTTAIAPKAVAPVPPPPRKGVTPAERAKALTLLEQGMRLAASGELVAGRAALADALNTGALPADRADAARKKLTELVDETLLSPRKYPDDPNVVWYKFKAGEVLARVERKLRLHVPTQLLLRINGIPDATKIQAGQTLKLLRGPFHAVIYKGTFIMEVYLEEPVTQRLVFVRRFRVGVGKDGSTPAGRWRVALNKKMTHAPWTPPVSSKLERRKIFWGEKGYPLGKKGYWIALEGIEGNIYTAEDGYGIHGTKDAQSIGRASSLGCIRLADKDIELVFAMLYEFWSTVTVRK